MSLSILDIQNILEAMPLPTDTEDVANDTTNASLNLSHLVANSQMNGSDLGKGALFIILNVAQKLMDAGYEGVLPEFNYDYISSVLGKAMSDSAITDLCKRYPNFKTQYFSSADDKKTDFIVGVMWGFYSCEGIINSRPVVQGVDWSAVPVDETYTEPQEPVKEAKLDVPLPGEENPYESEINKILYVDSREDKTAPEPKGILTTTNTPGKKSDMTAAFSFMQKISSLPKKYDPLISIEFKTVSIDGKDVSGLVLNIDPCRLCDLIYIIGGDPILKEISKTDKFADNAILLPGNPTQVMICLD